MLLIAGDWAGGRQIAGAAVLAVERVNADETLLLPNYKLEYSWANSGCTAKQALVALGKLQAASRAEPAGAMYLAIGPGCSEACEVTRHMARL